MEMLCIWKKMTTGHGRTLSFVQLNGQYDTIDCGDQAGTDFNAWISSGKLLGAHLLSIIQPFHRSLTH